MVAVYVLLVVAPGCGEEGGAEAGGTVAVYVAAPLCAEAKRELAGHGGRVGDVRVRAVCLSDAEAGDGLDLAALGANARRTTEDSSSVAYIGEPTRPATRFSSPILGEAGIAQLSNQPGDVAMSKLLNAVRRAINADSSESLRESVHQALD